MAAVIVERSTRHRIWQGVGLLLGVLLPLVCALFMGDYLIGQLSLVAAYAVAVLGLNLVTGFAGQISLGHGAFFGLGAYTTAILFADHEVSRYLCVVAAALLGLLVGFLVGLPALRLKGMYLAVVTLAVGVAFPVLVTQPLGVAVGTGGILGKPAVVRWVKPAWFGFDVSDRGFGFLVVCAIAGVMFWLATGITRSRMGLALLALRENETAAATNGVWPAEVKTVAFAMSAMFGAVGGALYMFTTPIISPEGVGFTITLLLITAMVLGGAATVSGAWLGGLAMVFLPYYTAELAGLGAFQAISDQPGLFANIIYGLILIVLVFVAPQGLMPLLTRLRERVVRIVPAEAAHVDGAAAAHPTALPSEADPLTSHPTDPSTAATAQPGDPT